MTSKISLKKMSGEFYTPPFIVDLMVERVFHYLILNKKIDDISFENFSNSLLKLKFLDPAVGTGNFLLGLLKFIWKKLSSYSKSLEHIHSILREFCLENIYALDINPNSVEQCKERISSELL